MALQGNLTEMAVGDLIQHTCQDGKTAQLTVRHQDQAAILFFKDGEIQHATLADDQGEEVIYHILTWQEGHFSLELGIPSPTTTINRSWSALLLEGARRLDETSPSGSNHSHLLHQEKKVMATKKKSELLADALTELITESSDIDGAAVVGVDGLVYSANVPHRALDENMVGASSAAVLGLSQRSANQLKRGAFKQTLIQGDDGNIIVVRLNDEALFVGLTASNVNLGMAFAEVRTMVERLASIL